MIERKVLKELVGDPAAFKAQISQMNDRELWAWATMACVCAGERAQAIGRDDVEEVVFEFVQNMHRLVGTPAVRSGTVQ